MRQALVKDGAVVNVIELGGGANWPVPEGHILIPAGVASPGDTYADGKFTRATPKPDPRQAARDEYAAASTTAERMSIIATRLGLIAED